MGGTRHILHIYPPKSYPELVATLLGLLDIDSKISVHLYLAELPILVLYLDLFDWTYVRTSLDAHHISITIITR